MKKALIFDPYLDTLGGGERYSLTFAIALIELGYSVELAWKKKETLDFGESRFGLNLSQIKLNEKAFDIFIDSSRLLSKYQLTSSYDLVFFVSDGSLPFLFSKNNLVHFQVPFKTIGGSPFLNKIKTWLIHKFIYNSSFTKLVHEKHFPAKKSFVLYPPIGVKEFLVGKKIKQIISVARFGSPSHSKRQDILIEAFKIFSQTHSDYSLLLTGGLFGGENDLLPLRNQAKGLSVSFVPNPSFAELKRMYSESEFFWHAAGYEVDEELDPEKVEHFGMTTVEAMASGCIPVVIAKGGQKEIITTNTGLLVTNAEEMANETSRIIKNHDLKNTMSSAGPERSKTFSTEKFNQSVRNLL